VGRSSALALANRTAVQDAQADVGEDFFGGASMGKRTDWGRKRWISAVVALASLMLGAVLISSCSGRVARPDVAGPIQLAAADRYTEVGPVQEGTRYRISADGQWKDWFIPATVHGFDSNFVLRIFESFRVLPGAKWFVLGGVVALEGATVRQLDRHVGQFGMDVSPFLVGSQTWVAPATGSLYVFANDVPWAYFNNTEAINFQIEAVNAD